MSKESLDLKVATEREALWLEVKEETEKRIKKLEGDKEINKELLKVAERIIEEEKNAP